MARAAIGRRTKCQREWGIFPESLPGIRCSHSGNMTVCGNKYRIVALIDYERQGMLIRFVGTHEQYDAIEDIEHI